MAMTPNSFSTSLQFSPIRFPLSSKLLLSILLVLACPRARCETAPTTLRPSAVRTPGTRAPDTPSRAKTPLPTTTGRPKTNVIDEDTKTPRRRAASSTPRAPRKAAGRTPTAREPPAASANSSPRQGVRQLPRSEMYHLVQMLASYMGLGPKDDAARQEAVALPPAAAAAPPPPEPLPEPPTSEKAPPHKVNGAVEVSADSRRASEDDRRPHAIDWKVLEEFLGGDADKDAAAAADRVEGNQPPAAPVAEAPPAPPTPHEASQDDDSRGSLAATLAARRPACSVSSRGMRSRFLSRSR